MDGSSKFSLEAIERSWSGGTRAKQRIFSHQRSDELCDPNTGSEIPSLLENCKLLRW